jgi:hypothetical protein
MYEIKNYTKEYYINNKLIGTIILEKPDREKLGYPGKRLEVLDTDIRFKKLYKKGTEVYTETSPICGKLKGSLKNKFQILANSRIKF